MSERRVTRRWQRGFSLLEVLVAVVVLLIGVIAALYIFPRGYNAFQEGLVSNNADKLIAKAQQEIIANPDSIPEWVGPPTVNSDAPSWLPPSPEKFFNDMTAVDYENVTPSSLAGCLFPAGSSNLWPEWQPLSLRVVRQVIGEKVTIPTAVSPSSSPADRYIQRYLPRYAPLLIGPAPNTPTDTLMIYDLRYRKVAALPNTTNTDKLFYTLNYDTTTKKWSFNVANPTAVTNIRVLFLYLDNANVLQQFGPALINFSGQTWPVDLKTFLPASVQTAFNSPVDGSEQFNRAYTEVVGPTIAGSQYWVDRLVMNTPTQPAALMLGAIHFAKDDAGHTVKMDYQVADWGILHEDLAVDTNGYITLSVPNPKITIKPIVPREPKTWGIYDQLSPDYPNVVMVMVDMHTGQVYHVSYNPNSSAATYRIIPEDTSIPASPADPVAIDLTNAGAGAIRLGTSTTNSPNWTALNSRVFRVYYRAARDWSVQVYRAPAQFWYLSWPGTSTLPTMLGWNRFTYDPNNTQSIRVPALYTGQTVAVDYTTLTTLASVSQSAGALCSATIFSSGTLVTVNTTAPLSNGQQLEVIDPTAPNDRPLVTVQAVTSATTFNLAAPLTVHPQTVFLPPVQATTPLCTVQTTATGNTFTVDSTSNVAVGMAVETVDAATSKHYVATIVGLPTTGQVVTLNRSLTLNANTALVAVSANFTTKSTPVSGEMHTITAPDFTGTSVVLLHSPPKPGTTIAVRGVSVTVRALWIQQRGGNAYTITDDAATPWPVRTLNERWTSRAVTFVLPSTTQ